MSEGTLEPAGFFEFDLARGAVRARGGERVLLVPDTVLGPLVASAVQAGDLTVLRRLGRQLGEQARAGLGDPSSRSVADVFGRLADLLALFGWGHLEIERWGPALLARLEEAPGLDDGFLAVAALLGGLISATSGHEVACVPVDQEGSFLVVHPSIAQEVWKWARAGDGVASIVGRLEVGS